MNKACWLLLVALPVGACGDPAPPGPPLDGGALDASTPGFSVEPSTVALWTFDGWDGLRIRDQGPNGLHLAAPTALPLVASPEDRALLLDGSGSRLSAGGDARLSIGRTGLLTLEARVFLDDYPSPSLHNQAATIVGKYEGLKLLVFADGRIQAGGQMGDGQDWGWYAPISKRGIVPTKRWVNLAVAADQERGQFYAYVDGRPVQLYTYLIGDSYQPLPSFSGTMFRSAPSDFVVGNDSADDQAFTGKIEAIRVSSALVLGRGPMAITTPEP